MNATSEISVSLDIVVGIGNVASFVKIVVATLISASLGQAENQSKAQQSTSDGNFLCLIRSASPTGLMHSTICNKFLTLSTNVL